MVRWGARDGRGRGVGGAGSRWEGVGKREKGRGGEWG